MRFPNRVSRLSLPGVACFALGELLIGAAGLRAHEVSFNSIITYSASQPAATADAVANWTGAAFDAANIGGSGVDGNGYELTGVTVRIAGYTNNTASGSNVTAWNLSQSTGPIMR